MGHHHSSRLAAVPCDRDLRQLTSAGLPPPNGGLTASGRKQVLRAVRKMPPSQAAVVLKKYGLPEAALGRG